VIATGFDRQVAGDPGMRQVPGSANVINFPSPKKMPAPTPQATTPVTPSKTEPRKGSSASADEMDIPTFIRRQMD
jgi:hypothetical protein